MAGLHQVNTQHDADKDHGVLVLVVRKDTLPAFPDVDSDDNDFMPLTLDANGYLRVNVPVDGVKVSGSPSVEDLLEETNSLLRRLVLSMELLQGHPVPDPR